MDSVVVNAQVIYKKKVNAKINLLNFKIILAESSINWFPFQKRITAEEFRLTVELPPPVKKPDHTVTNWKDDVKSFTDCKSWRAIVKSRNMLMNFWTCFSYAKVNVIYKSSIFLTKTSFFVYSFV